ncbi:MAG: PAS domain S-box protein, partial [Desulfobacteraceae bacterium]|nr:PAS domain S-box protein [Desulfobacteraceae bacterium]
GIDAARSRGVILVCYDLSALDSAAFQHSWQHIAVFVLSFFLFSLAFASCIYFLVIRRLLRLGKAMTAFSMGNDGVLLEESGVDEISSLYAIFNEMAATINKSRKKRLEMEGLLRREHDQAQLYLDIAGVMLCVLDTEGKIVLMNTKGRQILGYAEEEIIGRNWFDLCLPAGIKSYVKGVFNELISGNSEPVKYYENSVVTKTGEERMIAFHSSVLRNEAGKITGAMFSGEDVTERRQMEKVLEKASTEWSAAMDASDDVIYLLDLNRRVIRANKSFYAMTGLTWQAAFGKHIAEIVHPQGEIVPCAICLAQEERRDAVIIMEPDDPNNPSRRPIEITVKIVRDRQGQPLSIFMNLHDLTMEREMQEEKMRLEAQLHQSQKMEAIGQLAGGIAHDFNNMLTAISGYGSLLAGRLDSSSELRPFVDQILSAAEKSANLTKQLLAFSRKQVIAPRHMELNEFIGGMEKLLIRLIGEDIELKTSFSDEDLIVMVDPGQLGQVLMNLCTNARDAMPGGGLISIETGVVKLDAAYVKAHELEKTGSYAMISITDTGAGMDQKTMQKIFEPFFTTKEIGRGTGLGLSIVYGIVKQHNGNITVYSEPGSGATFRIYLPLIESNTKEAEPAKALTIQGGTETILLAEDNEDVRGFMRDMLQEFGYHVIEAVDGEDAIAKFKDYNEQVHLAMLDVIMPKKNGKEVYDEIKGLRPDVKVLFTSGYTADIIHKKGILETDVDFISKPAMPSDILAKIREILNR